MCVYVQRNDDVKGNHRALVNAAYFFLHFYPDDFQDDSDPILSTRWLTEWCTV